MIRAPALAPSSDVEADALPPPTPCAMSAPVSAVKKTMESGGAVRVCTLRTAQEERTGRRPQTTVLGPNEVDDATEDDEVGGHEERRGHAAWTSATRTQLGAASRRTWWLRFCRRISNSRNTMGVHSVLD